MDKAPDLYRCARIRPEDGLRKALQICSGESSQGSRVDNSLVGDQTKGCNEPCSEKEQQYWTYGHNLIIHGILPYPHPLFQPRSRPTCTLFPSTGATTCHEAPNPNSLPFFAPLRPYVFLSSLRRSMPYPGPAALYCNPHNFLFFSHSSCRSAVLAR